MREGGGRTFAAGDRVRIRPGLVDDWCAAGPWRRPAWLERRGTVTAVGLARGSGRLIYVRWDGQQRGNAIAPGWVEHDPGPASESVELCATW